MTKKVQDKWSDAETALAQEEDTLRRIVRRSLKPLSLPVLNTLLRAIRYWEEGKTPMAVAAEDLDVPYKIEAIFREAGRLRREKAGAASQKEEAQSEGPSCGNSNGRRQPASDKA